MFSLPKVSPNGTVARLFLSFLTSAGLYYVSIMPAIVEGLVQGLGFTNKQAGLAGSANVYGAAFGALVIVFIVKRIRWKLSAACLLVVLMLIDLFSILITEPNTLIAVRLIHGCIGGVVVGIGFAVIARAGDSDRTFGYLLLVAYGMGGLGVMFLPPLVPEFGTKVLFLALVAFSFVTLIMLVFLSDYPIDVSTSAGKDTHAAKIQIKPLIMTLLAIFLYQAANMGLFSFIIGLGKHYGLETIFISKTLGAAAWVGIVGALLVIVFSTRYGRTIPLLISIALTLIGNWMLHFSDVQIIFILANCGVGIAWAFVMPYLLGMAAGFDEAGQMSALGGFMSKMGLASGPFVAAFVLGEGNYALLINLSVASLMVCLIAALIPAYMLDKGNKESVSLSTDNSVADPL